MSSYLNNLLTTTTSKYNTLRRTLLSDEADGDTEDDTHLCRVFRAYYQEKGRPYPGWLPPDPKAPQAAAPTQFVSSQSGRQNSQQQMGRGGGGGLNDLWDAPQPPSQQEPASLRRAPGRGGGGRQLGRQTTSSPEPQAQGRPLPSQRGGSYQSASAYGGRVAEPSPPPPLSAGPGTTAQERLKARLWGSGRSTSSVQSAGSSANSSPATTPGLNAPTRNPYDRAPSQPGRPLYPNDRNSGYSAGGGGGGRQQSQQGSFAMSANSPWAGNDDPYGPNYDTGGYQEEKPKRPGGGGRIGLPSGPRMR